MQVGVKRLAGAAAAVALTFAAPGLAHAKATSTATLLGDAKARTMEVVPCNPPGKGRCPYTVQDLVGELPVTVTGGRWG